MNAQVKPKGSVKNFMSLVKTLHWPVAVTIVALVLSLVETAAGLAVPLITKDLVDSFTSELLNWKTGIFLLVLFVVQAIAGGFSYYMLAFIGETVVADLRNQLWQKVLRLPVPYFDQNETGETMSRITQDTTILKSLVSEHLVSFISGMISIIGAVIILLVLDWKMTIIMLISVPVSMAILFPLGRLMHKVAKATQAEMAKFSGHLGRVLGDIRLVKAYRAEPIEGEKGKNAIQSLFRYGLKEAKIQAVISPIMMLTMMGILVVILGYGGAQVAKGALSAGTLVAIIFLLFQIIIPFARMAQFFTSFQKAIGATERIQGILRMDSEPADGVRTSKMEGAITFSNVHFSYEDGKGVVNGISFTAERGTVTAFVGPSGGGKTTIFSLMERFYQPTSGEIRLGEDPIQTIPLSDWRRRIGYVSQESPLLSGTILDNIAYGLEKRPPLEQVIEAAKAANAYTFIKGMPDQFDTMVGERGMKLSGGQRQRIAIARALLHNPEILLLDEATSNLDSGSETHVQEALHHLMQGRTTLIIAHRLATVLHANQLLFLENGQITGRGNHAELLETHELYREFAEGQGLA
ncbi:multidrug ABC transporter permease [Sporosarcina sp. P21c]|uniref:ABC transporter ATP-binding protein n=1 Tax=unclassified Sporosarcina TaxID=2647733 RepID=UPI000C16825D|nr:MULTISPECIES: ABC transporter ATP-binding protein [unclassified Sporosarcina]PIC68437.1 multidrug ABC transporter permease [Sporosarcina sp. P16a]PIC88964.1 multidrug ABC transporter permease [Sporosarcina sp. P21c]PIC92208.1 multidrug ABC transporter permease [Sporosarcina sp. P25]